MPRVLGLQLTEVPEPSPGPGDVKLRVLRTGICGTDLHIESWDEWAASTIKPPLVVGHEFVGEVVEVGAGGHQGQGRRPRQRRGPPGLRHLPQLQGRPAAPVREHRSASACTRAGAFAEYAVLPEQNAWVHTHAVDLDVAAIFDPFGNAVHTALSFPVLGEDVLITGAGPIGLMAAAVAKHAGARHVVITDVSESRLELARKIGVDLALNVSHHADRATCTRELRMTEGFDVGMEMSGQPSALREMIANMTHGGRIAMLGLPADGDPDRLVAASCSRC